MCRDFPRDHVPLILTPLLYLEESEISTESIISNSQNIFKSSIMDTSWSKLIMEIGYSLTQSVEDCKTHLMKGGGRDITAQDVAKIISLMCLTHTNLSDSSINLPTPNAFWSSNSSQSNDPANSNAGQKEKLTIESASWKPEIFVQALKEVVPNLNWKEVCLGLDHPEFAIKDRIGLNLLITTIRLGFQSSGMGQNFPAECIYRHWQNVEGHLTLIAAILKNSDIYSFADHIYSSVPIEVFKTPPEPDNKEVNSWKSVHLVETLLYISENGYYNQVLEILKFPLQHCPDILFMALLHSNGPLTVLRQELFTSLVPVFLSNHPNSGPILHHAWNSSNYGAIKNIIMMSMNESYIRSDSDQSRLSRILDIAQDLKALSNLLNSRDSRFFMFVIDLACLASRREYLKLDKWLSDKLREHGDQFAAALVKFLQRRCPQIMGKAVDDQMSKSGQLQPETLNLIAQCLHAFIPNIHSPDVAEQATTIVTNCNLLLNKRRQFQPILRGNSQMGGMDASSSFSSAGLQNFQSGMNSVLSDLSAGMNALNLSAINPNSNAFNAFGNMLGNLGNTPASPSRLMSALNSATSNSPFSMQVNAPPPQQNLGRIGTTPTGDKLNILNPLPGAQQNPSAQPSQQSLFGEQQQQQQPISSEIEEEANGYFQRIYNHPPHPTLSIDEVLDMLKRFSESSNRREREVHHCMLRNLLEEYKFFPQYPEKELQITAQLFGGMIEKNLVDTYLTLGLALRYVLEALRKPEGSKMYYFGITAMDRFKNRLHTYQKYCEHVRSIPHFNSFPPHLIKYVEYGCNSELPPDIPQVPFNPTTSDTVSHLPITSSAQSLYRSNSVTGNIVTQAKSTPLSSTTTTTPSNSSVLPSKSFKSIANATNIDTLLVANETESEKIVMPPDAVQDKTAFIFNNLSQLNLTTKCEEIREILQKEYYAWMSQYLVLKRASIEINFHTLYSNLLEALKIQELLILTTNETFRNIKVLLRSDKSIANFSDRSLLKNLGHWLGMLTLGRNRPILHNDIDLKSLVLEAYSKGQQELLYVVPFVAKVIESASKSKVFKPPNPWTMAIMNVLAELHQEPELKLNLKFEIEVLCKSLNLEVADLKPAYYLKDPERIIKIVHQLSPPNKQIKEAISQPPPPPPIPTNEEVSNSVIVSSIQSASPANSTEAFATEPRYHFNDIVIQNFGSHISNLIVLSSTLVLLHPQLKSIVVSALDKTIREWVPPVVDRAVKISSKTTESIIRKDFALDSDDSTMRQAAHCMARNLAAGMAMITCKDQLISAIQTNVKAQLINVLAPQQKDQIDMASNMIANDNAELVCAFIQKFAIERAIPEIDKALISEYELRKMARQEGRTFCDHTVLAYQAERIPIQIRLKVGTVPSSQLAVYEEFGRNIPGFQRIADRELFAKSAIMDQQQPPPQPAQLPLATVTTPNISGIPTANNNNLQLSSIAANASQFSSSFSQQDDFGIAFEDLQQKIETFISMYGAVPHLQIQSVAIHAILEFLIVVRRTRENTAQQNLLKKTVENIMEGFVAVQDYTDQVKIYRDIHLRIINLLQDNRSFGQPWTNKCITKYVLECPETMRYNIEAIEVFISTNCIILPQYDAGLATLIESGNFSAANFATKLLQLYFLDNRPNLTAQDGDFNCTITILERLATHNNGPESLLNLLEVLKNQQDTSINLSERLSHGPTAYIHSGMLQARNTAEVDEPPGFIEKSEYLLKDWIAIFHTQGINRDQLKSFSTFVNKMNIYGILKGDEALTRFFRHATQMCIDLTYRNDPTITKTKIFQWIDAYVRLIALLVKHSGETSNSTTKLNLLNKVRRTLHFFIIIIFIRFFFNSLLWMVKFRYRFFDYFHYSNRVQKKFDR